MSKQQALTNMSDRAEALMRGDPRLDGGSREDVVTAWQRANSLKPDGWPGNATLSALWSRNKPSADDIVAAARAALDWPPVTYSMSRNTGMGESWLPDNGAGYATGDCSDFACHCLGVPKNQTNGQRITTGAPVWLGADAIASGHIGHPRPLADTQPGDLIVYPGKWERGERVAIGHVEVCFEVRGGRIVTIGCASSNARVYGHGAIAEADKTDRWRRKSAVAVRPWWNA
jgi:hypothetical protein